MNRQDGQIFCDHCGAMLQTCGGCRCLDDRCDERARERHDDDAAEEAAKFELAEQEVKYE